MYSGCRHEINSEFQSGSLFHFEFRLGLRSGLDHFGL